MEGEGGRWVERGGVCLKIVDNIIMLRLWDYMHVLIVYKFF